MKIKRYKSIYGKPVDPLKIIGAILMTLAFVGMGILIASLILNAGNNKEVTSSETSSVDILNPSVKPDEQAPAISHGGAIHAAFLPHGILSNSENLNAFVSTAKEQNITDVVITVKDEAGFIYFDSDYKPAQYIQNKAQIFDLKSVIKTLHDNGLNAVAQLHCFKDNIGGRIKNAGVLYSENHGVVWLDDEKEKGGKSWLNPYSDEAREYLEYLVDEVVDLGFDVIMLDSVRFPGGYQLYAYYGENLPSREQALRSFVTNMKTHLAEKDTEMWLYASKDAYVYPNSEIFSKNVFSLGADVVMFDAQPKNFPSKLAFGMIVIENPVQNPKKTVMALVNLAQESSYSKNIRLVPVLQAYTDNTIPADKNAEYTSDMLENQFSALEETAITDYAVYSPDGLK